MDFNSTTETMGQQGYEQMPPQPEKKKIPPVAIAGIVLAVVLVIAMGISIAVYAGLFGSKAGKVANAFVNTFSEQSEVFSGLGNTEIFKDKQYTASIEMEMEDVLMEMECRIDGLDKQFEGTLGYSIINIDFIGALTEDEFLLSVPFLSDQVFCYNYREIGDGYLLEDMDRDEIEKLNNEIAAIYDPQNMNDFFDYNEWMDDYAEELKNLDFENAEDTDFEIDGQDVTCKGYQTRINSEDMVSAVDELEEEFNEQNGEIYELIGTLEGTDNPYEALFDEVRSMFDEFSDFDLRFYIYDKKLAAIVAENDAGEQVRILFEGGERRSQNIVVEYEDEYETAELFAIRGETSGTEETISLVVDEESLSFTYDSESGDYEVVVDDGYGESTITGVITCEPASFIMTIDEFAEYGEDIGMEGRISVTRGAQMKEIEGERFDIGNADEDSFNSLMEEIMDALYSF